MGINKSDFFSETVPLEPIEDTLKEIEAKKNLPYKKSDRVEDLINNAHK